MTNLPQVVAASLFLVGCIPPKPPQLAPARMQVTRPPQEVVQLAARHLTADGFEVTMSDANGGLLTAKRIRTPEQQGDAIVCRYQRGSIAARTAEAHLTISVTAARVATGGSEVQIVSSVLAKSGTAVAPILRVADSADDCASSGIVEKRLGDVVK